MRKDSSIHEWKIENHSPLDLTVFDVLMRSGTSSIEKLLRNPPSRGYPGDKSF